MYVHEYYWINMELYGLCLPLLQVSSLRYFGTPTYVRSLLMYLMVLFAVFFIGAVRG